MSFDQAVRNMVAAEVAQALLPVHAALAELQGNGDVISRLAAALGQPIKRGPGRPPKKSVVSAFLMRSGAKRGRKPAAKRACAIIDCGRPSLSKGYCGAHYQKLRMLDSTGRLPRDWVADAAPGTVTNVALPRGRAGAKALAGRNATTGSR